MCVCVSGHTRVSLAHTQERDLQIKVWKRSTGAHSDEPKGLQSHRTFLGSLSIDFEINFTVMDWREDCKAHGSFMPAIRRAVKSSDAVIA